MPDAAKAVPVSVAHAALQSPRDRTPKGPHMQVEISTDNNVPGSAELSRRIEEELRTALSRFSDHLTRLDAHLSDGVAAGAAGADRRCVLEARPKASLPSWSPTSAARWTRRFAGRRASWKAFSTGSTPTGTPMPTISSIYAADPDDMRRRVAEHRARGYRGHSIKIGALDSEGG
ncbi:MAG TPA: hypothetical protein VG674_28110, partial [Amycolatopsis sp.]|nr:hypothetical protein [Amycolatopsis sp.]